MHRSNAAMHTCKYLDVALILAKRNIAIAWKVGLKFDCQCQEMDQSRDCSNCSRLKNTGAKCDTHRMGHHIITNRSKIR